MNLFETVQLIQDTAKETVESKLLPIPNDPESYLLLSQGKHEVIKAPFTPGPRKHRVETVESFAAAYARWSADGSDRVGTPPGGTVRQPNIWIDLTNWRLLFYVDEPLRRSSVCLTLKPSPQLATVQQFRNAVPLDQKKLVRMLRHDLADCVEPGILAAFRSVDFQKIRTVRAQQQHEKQSLDADIVAQTTGEKKPEGFMVDFPLFAMKELADARSRVGITIDIDCEECKFVLQAKPGHLDVAIDDARAAVLTALENGLSANGHADVTILDGTPE